MNQYDNGQLPEEAFVVAAAFDVEIEELEPLIAPQSQSEWSQVL